LLVKNCEIEYTSAESEFKPDAINTGIGSNIKIRMEEYELGK
jgi:hypothetical protein